VRNIKLAAWAKDRMKEAHACHGPALVAAVSALPAVVKDALKRMLGEA
jgi:hypothetical protein